MKKILFSVGLVAGAAGLTSAFAQGMESASPKIWNASATLRGFYDDNYTVGSGNDRKGSGGLELSPKVSANLDLKQTDIGVSYIFGMYYYADRSGDKFDYSHQANLWLDHAFDETLKLNISDTFVASQDPELNDGGAVYRVNGNNIMNRGNVKLTKDWTRKFSTATYYNNTFVNYSDGPSNPDDGSNPSQAGLLNRMEQKVGNDFQWQFQPQTMGFIGYAYSWVRYLGDEYITTKDVTPGNPVKYSSGSRNIRSHYGYVGVEHVFSPNLSMVAKAGASLVDAYNDPQGSSESVAPYADISATYTYVPGSYVQAGFHQDVNSTSVASPGNNAGPTLYQETSVFYMDITHRFDAKWTGSVVSQYAFSRFEQGQYSGDPENTVNVGVNLAYQINRIFSAEAGYNFDELFSNVQSRGNTRNRVYLGLTASY
jgi:hypothetical protein